MCCSLSPLVIFKPLRAEGLRTSRPVVEFSRGPAASDASPTFLRSLGLVLLDVVSALSTLLRACQLTVLCTPLFVATPLVLWWPGRYLERWCDLLVWTVERCGPISTKLGQWASTRRDLFPEALCRRLSRLQRKTRPHPWRDTESTLVETLGTEYGRLFGRFDPVPIGSGCCAQVRTFSKQEIV